MQVELIEAIKEFLIDAVKILGPASIAALVAYRTARVQYEMKLAELNSNNRFETAKILFDLYKERYDQINSSYKAIAESVFQLTGVLSGSDFKDSVDLDMLKLFKVYANKLPFYLESTLSDFEKHKESKVHEYNELRDAKSRFEGLGEVNTENYFDYAVQLESIYSIILMCGQILIEYKMDEVLADYTVNK